MNGVDIIIAKNEEIKPQIDNNLNESQNNPINKSIENKISEAKKEKRINKGKISFLIFRRYKRRIGSSH